MKLKKVLSLLVVGLLLVGLFVPFTAFGGGAEVPTFVVPVDSSNPHFYIGGDKWTDPYTRWWLPILPSFNGGVCIREFLLAFAVLPAEYYDLIRFGSNFRFVVSSDLYIDFNPGFSVFGRAFWGYDEIICCGEVFELINPCGCINPLPWLCSSCEFIWHRDWDECELFAETVHFTIEIFENDVLIARIVTEEATISDRYGIFGSVDFTTESEHGATGRVCSLWSWNAFENLRFENRNLTATEFTYEYELGIGGLSGPYFSWLFNLSNEFVATLAPGTHIFEAVYSYSYWVEGDTEERTGEKIVPLSLYIPADTPPTGDCCTAACDCEGECDTATCDCVEDVPPTGDSGNQGTGNQNQNNPYKTPPAGEPAIIAISVVAIVLAVTGYGIMMKKKAGV
ncbi:MAG: hypothetical protein FWB93_05890 [Oscillospiraceae bacterium]|nr:hypothetical protein [Oscillospiraceae bacterium]